MTKNILICSDSRPTCSKAKMKSEKNVPRFVGPTAKYISDVVPKDASVGIDCITRTISTRPGSHRGAWARILKLWLINSGYRNVTICQDDSEWTPGAFQYMILEHGMEFDGVFNLFGGANDELATRISRFLDMVSSGTVLLSWEVPMPSLSSFVEARHKSGSDLFKQLKARIDEIRRIESSAVHVDAVAPSDHLCIGDSHILSAWTPSAEIRRYDGRTLYGSLRDGAFETMVYGKFSRLTSYFGNIDVRHHLMRQENPVESTIALADKYVEKLYSLKSSMKLERVEAISLIPIESESRRLPKTGYYRGTAFFGTRHDRQNLVNVFNSRLIESGLDVYGWPPEFTKADGELKLEVMEKPHSVHISPEFYRYQLP